MLVEAIRAAKALPEPQQDAIAGSILAEIEDERRWTEAFGRSPDVLAELARKALGPGIWAGRTLRLDPDNL